MLNQVKQCLQQTSNSFNLTMQGDQAIKSKLSANEEACILLCKNWEKNANPEAQLIFGSSLTAEKLQLLVLFDFDYADEKLVSS